MGRLDQAMQRARQSGLSPAFGSIPEDADLKRMVSELTDEFAHKRDVLYEHCAAVGRDPKEITLSSHVRLGPDGEPGPVAETAAALGERGLDLAIVTLPPPHRADAKEPSWLLT